MIIAKFLYIYIIQCADESYYIGVTNDLRERYIAHEQGINPQSYTFNRRPFKLVYWELWDNPGQAIAREKQLKGWSRAKKKALIEQNIDQLKFLARGRNNPSASSG